MKHRWAIGLGCLVALGATGIGAQTMKPGLWEIKTKTGGGSPEHEAAMARAQKSMESMPPEQRKMMQEMMAKQGVSLDAVGGGGMAIKMCMTQAMIDKNQVARPDKGNCKQTSMQRTGNTLKFSVACTDPVSTGEGVVQNLGPEAYTSKMTFRSTQDGVPHTMVMESSGKFLSTDCGGLKPPPMN